MNTTVFRLLVIVFAMGLFACSSSKFKYREAYKFSNYNYQKAQEPAEDNADLNFEPLASASPDLGPAITTRSQITFPKTAQATSLSKPAPPKQAPAKLTRKEKKVVKQNIRHQLKEVLKEQKILRKEAKNKKTAMNRKVYSGLIIAGAGIVVAILVSGTIGGLAIIVGVALIAWGLIEEGSI